LGPIETVFNSNYDVGKNKVGPPAYPPLMLFKCFLLQKWFRIDSDPELENQINDSNAFRKFLGLSLDTPSPDHSTFSRFRGRLSKRQFEAITQTILNQFSKEGIIINEGIAIDARIVRFASKPLSNKRLKAIKKERSVPEGQLDKTGKPRKFSRDIESNWTIKNDKSYFGLKEHASIDINHGFILATALSPAFRTRH
jgi:IS5 family transposase